MVRLRALVLVGVLAAAAVAGYTWVRHGLSARDQPSAIEVFVAATLSR